MSKVANPRDSVADEEEYQYAVKERLPSTSLGNSEAARKAPAKRAVKKTGKVSLARSEKSKNL